MNEDHKDEKLLVGFFSFFSFIFFFRYAACVCVWVFVCVYARGCLCVCMCSCVGVRVCGLWIEQTFDLIRFLHKQCENHSSYHFAVQRFK